MYWSRLSDLDMLSEMEYTNGDQLSLDDDEYTAELGFAQVLFDLIVGLIATEVKDCRSYTVSIV